MVERGLSYEPEVLLVGECGTFHTNETLMSVPLCLSYEILKEYCFSGVTSLTFGHTATRLLNREKRLKLRSWFLRDSRDHKRYLGEKVYLGGICHFVLL